MTVGISPDRLLGAGKDVILSNIEIQKALDEGRLSFDASHSVCTFHGPGEASRHPVLPHPAIGRSCYLGQM
jgi:hypothetical protein